MKIKLLHTFPNQPGSEEPCLTVVPHDRWQPMMMTMMIMMMMMI